MAPKIFFFIIVIFITRTQLISAADPVLDEDPRFTTDRATHSPSAPEACRPSENPRAQSDQSETEREEHRVAEVTLRHLDKKIKQIQEVVVENRALLSKLKRPPVHQDPHYPRHCLDLKQKGHNVSDVYFIKPKYAPEPFLVFCDMVTRGGGWTVLLARVDGSLDFDVHWKDYQHGFGKLRHEFWLGLEKIHYLTGYEINELLIEVHEWGLKEAYFSGFSIGNEDEDFSVKLMDGYMGDTGSSLVDSYGVKFSTKDKSTDPLDSKCAILSGGGWWHKNCGSTILTSKWTLYNVMSWEHSKMMIRPRDTK